MKDTKDRNIQFEYIAALKEEFLSQNNPVLSIDSKKKELIGDFFRDGESYSMGPIKVNDHDFKSFSDGEITPHGIYDIKNNKCYLTIGTSKDTAEFVADNIEYHWGDSISHDYPGCEKILILCDGGGSNNCRHYVVKEQFYGLANKLGVEIVMAHYPAYCSKWNPIEHKAFCHISRAWEGAVFNKIEKIKELAEKATTKTGFMVKAWINNKAYKTGNKASALFMENMPVNFSDFLPKWNYSFTPKLL